MVLSEAREKDVVAIVKVGGPPAFRRRLLEMGFLKGVLLTVEKYAPLKDPLEVVIKGCHVSLRVEEAAEIAVEPGKETA
jgi:Fe2+ transport system protein FeoA